MMLKRFIWATLALLLLAAPARGQFNDQRNYATFVGGADGNNIVITIPNYPRNLVGVPLRFVPVADNTDATVISVSGVGSTAVRKRTQSGLAPLTGGEIKAGQLYEVMFDGTFYEITWVQGGRRQVSHTSSYTANPQDCDTTQVLSGGMFTVTVGAAGSFAPSCPITFLNNDSRGKGFNVAGGVGKFTLWPGKAVTLTAMQAANNWNRSNTERFNANNVTVFVNVDAGSDDPSVSDCLGTGVGACRTVNHAIQLYYNEFLPQFTNGDNNIQVDCTATHINENVSFPRVLANGAINLIGNVGTPLSCVIDPLAGGMAVAVQDHANAVIVGFEIGFTNGNGQAAIWSRDQAITDAGFIFFGNNPGGIGMLAQEQGIVNVTGSMTLGGNMAGVMQATGQSRISMGNAYSYQTNPNVGTFASADLNSNLVSDGGAINFTAIGGSSITGTRWLIGFCSYGNFSSTSWPAGLVMGPNGGVTLGACPSVTP